MGVVGRAVKTRNSYKQALKVAKITSFAVEEIYTGGRHSFLKKVSKNKK